MSTPKVFIAGWVFYLANKLRLYVLWSKLYRFVKEQRYANIEIATYESYNDLSKALKTLIWRADSWENWWDTISLPQRVQYILSYSFDKHVGDCDEFAIYIATALNKSIATGRLSDVGLKECLFMSVAFIDKNSKIAGHNVALLVSGSKDKPLYRYMDYGMPSRLRSSIEEVVQDAASSQRAGQILGYAIHTSDLKLVDVKRWKRGSP